MQIRARTAPIYVDQCQNAHTRSQIQGTCVLSAACYTYAAHENENSVLHVRTGCNHKVIIKRAWLVGSFSRFAHEPNFAPNIMSRVDIAARGTLMVLIKTFLLHQNRGALIRRRAAPSEFWMRNLRQDAIYRLSDAAAAFLEREFQLSSAAHHQTYL